MNTIKGIKESIQELEGLPQVQILDSKGNELSDDTIFPEYGFRRKSKDVTLKAFEKNRFQKRYLGCQLRVLDPETGNPVHGRTLLSTVRQKVNKEDEAVTA